MDADDAVAVIDVHLSNVFVPVRSGYPLDDVFGGVDDADHP